MSIAAICNAAVLSPLQRVQNAAARVVLYLGLRDITWHQRWSSYTLVGYLSNTELKYKLCTHQIQTGRTPQWPQHLAHVGSSRRPGLRSANTADYIHQTYVALELNSVNVASVTLVPGAAWNFLPDSKLTIQTLIDYLKNLLKTHLAFWNLLAPLDIL